jgi:hypothetical protein
MCEYVSGTKHSLYKTGSTGVLHRVTGSRVYILGALALFITSPVRMRCPHEVQTRIRIIF